MFAVRNALWCVLFTYNFLQLQLADSKLSTLATSRSSQLCIHSSIIVDCSTITMYYSQQTMQSQGGIRLSQDQETVNARSVSLTFSYCNHLAIRTILGQLLLKGAYPPVVSMQYRQQAAVYLVRIAIFLITIQRT